MSDKREGINRQTPGVGEGKVRAVEIDRLIQKSREDMTRDPLSEERFATLTVSLENEQKQLKAAIPEMEATLDAATDKAADLQRFIERSGQVTRLTKLTPEIVHAFIDKIMVFKPDKLDGKRHQRVDIPCNTIDLWAAPDPEELMGAYGLLQSHAEVYKKRRRSRSHTVQIR